MLLALEEHWPEYAIEGLLLGLFMLSASVAVCLVEHPGSWTRRRVRSALVRRAFIGVFMGVTAVALITSPLGQRSGAHMNPAVTLTFFALGKVAAWDAAFYIGAHVAGGALGMLAARALLRRWIGHEAVRHVATRPGRRGAGAAWAGEFVISFVLMTAVLHASNHAVTAPYTPFLAGALVATFIAVEAPLSGMSMNPARTLASALAGRSYTALWVYFTAPPLAMLLAGAAYAVGPGAVFCAKLDHRGEHRCIFHCRIDELGRAPAPPDNSGGISPADDKP